MLTQLNILGHWTLGKTDKKGNYNSIANKNNQAQKKSVTVWCALNMNPKVALSSQGKRRTGVQAPMQRRVQGADRMGLHDQGLKKKCNSVEDGTFIYLAIR